MSARTHIVLRFFGSCRLRPDPAPGRRIGFAALGAIVLTLAGCTSVSPERKLDVRGELDVAGVGRAEVVVVREARDFSVVTPMTGKEIADEVFGEIGSVRDPWLGDIGAGRDPMMVLAIPWMIGLQVVGSAEAAVLRAVAGKSERSTDEKQAAISLAVRALPLDEAVARAVQSRLESILDGHVTRLADVSASPETETQRSRSRKVLASQAGERDVVVRVKLFFQGLQTRGKEGSVRVMGVAANPPLVLVLAVQVMAVDARTGEMVGGTSAAYESTPRTFAAWGANNAAALRAEIVIAESEMTQAVVGQIRGGRVP